MRGTNSLARWSGLLFVVAGGLLSCSVLMKGIDWFTVASPPEGAILVVAVPGLFAALGGLFGLYPRLAGWSPWLSLAGAVSTAFSGVGLLVTVVWSLSGGLLSTVTAGVIPATPPEVVFISLVAALAVAVALFGGASVRAAGPWRRIGGFLLGYAATYIALIVVGATLATVPDWLYFAIYGAQPVMLLATGISLRRTPVATASELPRDDAVTG